MAITKKTVLVVGAGAHCEYGMPGARDLTLAIINRTWPPAGTECHFGLEDVRGGKGTMGGNQFSDDLDIFRDVLKISRADSIDQYVEDNEEYKLLGSILIAAYLLAWESHAARMATLNGVGELYAKLFKRMRPTGGFGSSGDAIDYGSLSIVTFNYDRLGDILLHNLACARRMPGCNMDRVNPKVLPHRVHIYGALESPYEFHPLGTAIFPKPTGAAVGISAKRILLATDREPQPGNDHRLPESIRQSRELLRDAETIAFLGFSFNPTNVKLLGFDGSSESISTFAGKRICASCYGMNDNEKRRAERLLGRSVAWHDQTASQCLDLFELE